jgi:hypothetical protein
MGAIAPLRELEEVPMPIVGGLDIYRKQITFDYLDTVTDVRLPGLHAHLREIQERALLAEADHDLETDACEAESG